MINDQVVHETIDGETVVINLASGTYFSLEGSGADLWARLLAGESPRQSAASLATRCGGDVSALTCAITAFYRELFEHGLVTTAPVEAPPTDGTLGTFEVPVVSVYDDLREHLLLDPVHDVERGAGWPAATTGT